MATLYLTSNELTNLENELFYSINQSKRWKKTAILAIYIRKR